MYRMDKYTVFVENKSSLIAVGVIFILLMLLLLAGDDQETFAGEITMPIAPEQQERPRAETPRKILGAEKANMDDRLADPFSIAHLTREEMEQAKLAAERRRKEDIQREAQSGVQVPVPVPVLQEDKAVAGRDIEDKSITLQGIIRGEHGAMAILKYGDKSMTAAVGEAVGGRTVKEIGSDEVRFDDGGCVGMQMP